MSQDHVQALAETSDALPPILVHYETMNVIDGMHRLSAARLNGSTHITAQFFHGSVEEAFRLAVRSNVRHGLPLTLADRQAAATRIIHSSPDLSDRSIAAITGMAAKTVAALRRRLAGGEVPERRTGRDGKVRPVSTAEGRRIASRAIAAKPDASLREIARQAGVSVNTVRDVRARVRAGEDPVPPRQRTGEATTIYPDMNDLDVAALLEGLRRDPSLRYTESGRNLLRWLATRAVGAAQAREATTALPAHCAIVVARIARECARVWNELADELDGSLTSY